MILLAVCSTAIDIRSYMGGFSMYATQLKDEVYCKEQIILARKAFGDRRTTRAQFEAMEKCLGMIYLHGPSSLMPIVLATLDEATYRKSHYILHFWPTQGE